MGMFPLPVSTLPPLLAPILFADYLQEQIDLLLSNHQVPVTVGISQMSIPLHFALGKDQHVGGDINSLWERPLRDVFDVPDLATTDDEIVNGQYDDTPDVPQPLALFTAPRIDYSLYRLEHYTATHPEHFQNYVLFTNYQFYMDEFVALCPPCIT